MASGDRYYCLAALPAPGDLGSTPPVTPMQLLELVGAEGGIRELMEVLFLQDDLLQREAFLAGETAEVSPAVLTPRQARNEEPLPGRLAPPEREERAARAAAVDDLWETYFRYAAATAREHGSRFLGAWVGREVAIRNELVAARAKRLGLDAGDYVVAADLAEPECDLSATIGEWDSAPDPLEATRVLIRARWAWVVEHAGWFSFEEDELVAYAAQLMLLQQWRRLAVGGQLSVVSGQ